MKPYKKILMPIIPLTSIVFVVSCGNSNTDDDKNKWEKVMKVEQDDKHNVFYEVPIKVEYTYRGSEIRTVVVEITYAKSVWNEIGRKPRVDSVIPEVAFKVWNGNVDLRNISIINIEPSTI